MVTLGQIGRMVTLRWAFPRSGLVAFGFALVGMLLLSQLIPQASDRIADAPWLTMLLQLSVLLLCGGIGIVFWVPLQSNQKYALAVAWLSLFLVAMVMLTLKQTPFPVGGVNGDQGMYIAYVTKLAAHTGFVDVIYADLPAFYPPLYFYGLAHLATALSIEPYLMLKYGLIATVFLLPFLVTWSWRQLVPLPFAAAAAFSLLIGQQWNKPAEWLTMALFVPWWLYFVDSNRTDDSLVDGRCTDDSSRDASTSRGQGWRWWLAGSISGGLLFQTYYYWFFVGGISLLLRFFQRERTLTGGHTRYAWLFQSTVMLAGAALVSAIYWIPYLSSMAWSGGWQVLQNRWLAEGKIAFPAPFADASIQGVLLAGGFIYLLVNATSNAVARNLLRLVIAVYVWIALGYVGMLIDQPLLTLRAYPLLEHLLAVAAAFGLVQLWQTVHAQPWQRRMQLLWPGLMLAILLVLGQQSVELFLKDEYVAKARTAEKPTAQLAALDQATGGAYVDKTILMDRDHVELLAYRPLDSFLAWSAYYSHPAGRFGDRVDFLEELAVTNTPQLFAAALMNNRYDQIDYLFFTWADDRWKMSYLADNFPNRNLTRTFGFAAENLVEPYFRGVDVTGHLLLIPKREQNLLTTGLPVESAMMTVADAAWIYSLVSSFGPHLDWPEQHKWQSVATDKLIKADLTKLPASVLVDLQRAAQEDSALQTNVRAALMRRLVNPADMQLFDQNGVALLHFLGHEIEAPTSTHAEPTLALYVEVLAPLAWDYTIWLHANSTGQQHNLDFTPNLPTTAWQVGKIYRLPRRLPITLGDLSSADYSLRFGLWQSEADVRILQSSGDIGVDLK